MTIQQALNKIRNATYGKDVRDALHDGISLCYNDRVAGGSYTSATSVNTFYSGIGLFPSNATNRPFDAPFLLIAAGSDTSCCQIAYDQNNGNNPKIRKKENGSWSSWSNL